MITVKITKVIAKHPCVMDGDTKATLTVGKVYEVVSTTKDTVKIIDDENDEHYFTFEKGLENDFVEIYSCLATGDSVKLTEEGLDHYLSWFYSVELLGAAAAHHEKGLSFDVTAYDCDEYPCVKLSFFGEQWWIDFKDISPESFTFV